MTASRPLPRARALLDSGDVYEAGPILLDLLETTPTLGAEKLLLRAIARVDPVSLGRDWLQRAETAGLRPAAAALAHYRLAQRADDTAAIVATGEAWLAQDREANRPRDLVPLMRALLDSGRPARVIALADDLLAQHPESRATIECRTLALMEAHDTDALIEALRDWLRSDAARPAWVVALKQVFRRAPTTMEAASALFAELCARWPDAPEVAHAAKGMVFARDPDGTWVSQRQRVARVAGISSDAAYLDAAFDAELPSMDESKAQAVRDQLAAALAATPLQRPLLRSDPYAAIQASPDSGSGDVVLAFAGLRGDNAGATLDAFFAMQGIDAVYLRDLSGRMFLHGLPGLRGGFAGMVDALRDTLAAHAPLSRLTVWGTSGSGVAALRAACALGADRFVGFGATTDVTLDFQQRYRDVRAPHLIAQLNRDLPAEDLQARVWMERDGFRMPTELHFGSFPPHAAHARLLDGLPNVTLHELPGLTHENPMNEAIRRGCLPDIIAGRFTHYPRA